MIKSQKFLQSRSRLVTFLYKYKNQNHEIWFFLYFEGLNFIIILLNKRRWETIRYYGTTLHLLRSFNRFTRLLVYNNIWVYFFQKLWFHWNYCQALLKHLLLKLQKVSWSFYCLTFSVKLILIMHFLVDVRDGIFEIIVDVAGGPSNLIQGGFFRLVNKNKYSWINIVNVFRL